MLAAETKKYRSTRRDWASAPQPMQEGNRLVALVVWHRLGYPIKSYRGRGLRPAAGRGPPRPEEPEGPMAQGLWVPISQPL